MIVVEIPEHAAATLSLSYKKLRRFGTTSSATYSDTLVPCELEIQCSVRAILTLRAPSPVAS